MASAYTLKSQSYEGRYMSLYCTQTRDISTNTSKINWTLTVTGGTSTYYTTGPTTVKINGETVYYKEQVNWSKYVFPAAPGSVSGSITVQHDNEGKATIPLSITTNIYTGVIETKSGTWTLDSNERFAVIESAPDFNDEENPTITYSNPAGNSITSLRACISLDGSKADIEYRDISKTGTSYKFNLTDAERDLLRSATTGSNSRKVKFYVRSEIGDSYSGSNLTRTFTIKNPKPTINPTIKDTNYTTIALTGDSSKLIRYYSNAAITIGAAAVKKATLKSQKVTCGSTSLTSDGTINAIASNNFVFTATDSRGNTTEKTVTPPFVDYIKLTCSLANNMPDGDGNMTINASGNYFNGSFGAAANSLVVYYRYKIAGGSYSSWTEMTVSKSGNTYSATALVDGLDYQTAYVFQTYAKDALATVYSVEKTVKATPVFDWSEDDFNFNVPVTIGRTTLSDNAIGVGGTTLSTNLTGVCNVGDYVYTVYPLCKLSATDSATCNSFTQGIFYFHRVNGLDAPKFLMVQAENQYSKAYRFNVSVLGEIPFNASMTVSDGYGFRTCRFQYNSEWYGGLAIIISNANLSHVSFVGTNYNNTITGIDIYNRNTGAILNSEVYDSILYDYGDFKNTLYRNTATAGLEAYPVNSIYISYSHTSPAELFGGTWYRIQSRFLWGTTTEGTIGATAGEQTHVLTVSEMPSHRHSVTGRAEGNTTSGAIVETYASYGSTRTAYTEYTGGGNAHNNMPPYVNVAIWRRTA